MKPSMGRRSARSWSWWSWCRRAWRTRKTNRNRNSITIAETLPKSLGRPWPPLALPWDLPLLPTHTTSLSRRGRVCVVTLDGHLLQNYALGPAFPTEALAIYSQLEPTRPYSIQIQNALNRITIDQGMPPASHPWVMENIVEEALRSTSRISCPLKPGREITQTEFLEALHSVLMEVAKRLKTRPLRVSYTITTYDGKSILQLLNNKRCLEKALEMTWKSLPKDRHGKLGREYVPVGLDIIAPAAGLPPSGAVQEVKVTQIDDVVCEVLKMVEGEERGVLNRKEFKVVMLEIMSSMMHRLERYPISVSSNAVIIDK